MHPAFSIIFFTAASGIGYGLLAIAGLAAAFGLLPESRSLAITATVFALALASAGLAASLLHLGRPERAWRALSQWRTSWLSREGVAALATFAPALGFAAIWAFAGDAKVLLGVAGLLTFGCCVVTVACTAMIYASLKPIHAWRNRWVLPNYLSLSLMTGGLWLAALIRLWGFRAIAMEVFCIALVALAFALKEIYWRHIASKPSGTDIASATGLGRYGRVRAFEAPHTEENYLLREMGFRIGRKHAARLRAIARSLAFIIPWIASVFALFAAGPAGAASLLIAALAASLGVTIERWLFFAEARHTVTLYYGRDDADAGASSRA